MTAVDARDARVQQILEDEEFERRAREAQQQLRAAGARESQIFRRSDLMP